MLQEKKTGSFEIQHNGRTWPVDVYHQGQQIRFKISTPDCRELNAYWMNGKWSGQGGYTMEEFIPLLEKAYPQFQAPSAGSGL